MGGDAKNCGHFSTISLCNPYIPLWFKLLAGSLSVLFHQHILTDLTCPLANPQNWGSSLHSKQNYKLNSNFQNKNNLPATWSAGMLRKLSSFQSTPQKICISGACEWFPLLIVFHAAPVSNEPRQWPSHREYLLNWLPLHSLSLNLSCLVFQVALCMLVFPLDSKVQNDQSCVIFILSPPHLLAGTPSPSPVLPTMSGNSRYTEFCWIE